MMGPCHLQQTCSLAKEQGLILGDDIPRVLFCGRETGRVMKNGKSSRRERVTLLSHQVHYYLSRAAGRLSVAPQGLWCGGYIGSRRSARGWTRWKHGYFGRILLSGIEEKEAKYPWLLAWKDCFWAFWGTLHHIWWYQLLPDRHWRAPAACASLCSFDPEHSDTSNLCQTLLWRKRLLPDYQRMTRQNTMPGRQGSGERDSSSCI